MGKQVSKSFRWILAVLMFGFATCAASGDALEPEVEGITKHYSSLQASDALYDRVPRLHEDFAPLREELHRLDDAAKAVELRSLLGAADPKVRTLGIVLAIRECRLDVLPDIALLVDDPAQTFPHASMTSESFPPASAPTDPTEVSQYAVIAIRMYVPHSHELTILDQTGKLPLSNGKALAQVMRAFAAIRDVRLSTAGLLVAMDQATGGISPLQPGRILRAQKVLAELEQIPMPRRFFVANALDFDRYRVEQYSPDFLLDLARQVPREARWAAVMGKQSIDDPDLPPGAGSHYFLDHAADLFMANDEDLQKSYGIDEAQRNTHFEPLKSWQESLKQTVNEFDH